MILGAAKSAGDLGVDFGAGLYAAEVDFLIGREWARTVEDILWRRTKFGLHADRIDMPALAAYVQEKAGGA